MIVLWIVRHDLEMREGHTKGAADADGRQEEC
jgi:hypothetical protein